MDSHSKSVTQYYPIGEKKAQEKERNGKSGGKNKA
jgi:hypothetical protein